MLNIITIFAILPIALCLFLVIREKELITKISLSGLATVTASFFIVCLGFATNNYIYFDVATVYALISFMGAIGYGKILNKQDLN